MITILKIYLSVLLVFWGCTLCWSQSECEVLDYTTSIQVKSNKLVKKESFLIQINDKRSNWIADIKIPFDKNDKLEILEAVVKDLNGNIVRKIRNHEITTRNDIARGAFYEDDFIKEFELKWDAYPYQIKYSYQRITDRFLYIAKWYPGVNAKVFTHNATLEVDVPDGFSMRIDTIGGFIFREEKLKNATRFKWQKSDISSFESEYFSPPGQETVPHVIVIPNLFNYELKGSFDSWQSYGIWQDQMNDGLDVLPPSEQLKIDRLVAGTKDPKEVIKILYHYLQDNTRYIGVFVDEGGLKPYSASYVCENGYGDCKALTIYLKALLNHVGIPSFYTKIYSGENPVRINQAYPSQQFNHVILVVPLQGDTIWLENTASYLPFDYLGTFTQNRYGLLVNGEKSELVKTPTLSQADVLRTTTCTFNLNLEGNGTAKVSEKLRGDDFETCKYYQTSRSKEDQKDYIEESIPLRNFQIEDWKFSQENRDSASMCLDVEMQVKDQFRTIGGMIVLNPKTLRMPDINKPEDRKTPVRITFPINKLDSIIYYLPFYNDYEVELPKSVLLKSDFGCYEEHYLQKDSALFFTRRFQLYDGDYPLDRYSEIYAFFDSIKDVQHRSAIVLNPN
ncbi:transglutaminase family protein [uncultured Sunxiuqinia sp.]|uniref:transglutaminase-like domain-containing protein n=1 Tax=uncultured Sunxiuqinia sp. TaxID=1573825 RepID=UPI00374925B5